jgi:hypothetical protein
MGCDRRRRARALLRRAHAERDELVDPRTAAQRQDSRDEWRHNRQQGRDRRRGGRSRRHVALYPAGGDRHRGSPLLFALRSRSAGAGARHAHERHERPHGPGRLHAHPAACQEPVSLAGADAGAQGAGGAARLLAGAEIHQGPDPGDVSQPRLLRVERLWRRGGLAALLQQVGARRQSRRSGAARGPSEGSFTAVAGPRPRGGGGARTARARRNARGRLHQRFRDQDGHVAGADTGKELLVRRRALCRRHGDGPGPRA